MGLCWRQEIDGMLAISAPSGRDSTARKNQGTNALDGLIDVSKYVTIVTKQSLFFDKLRGSRRWKNSWRG